MKNDLNPRQKFILSRLDPILWVDSGYIDEVVNKEFNVTSSITVDRDLSYLMYLNYIEKQGKGRSTEYKLSSAYNLIREINPAEYFKNDINKRIITERFNFDIFPILKQKIISDYEDEYLKRLSDTFNVHFKQLSETIIKREFERAIIEFSWKSSALEGNTYTLLETETLIKEGIEGQGKSREESIMILNHKKAIEFILSERQEFQILDIKKIEYLHSLIIDGLGVEKNIRKTLVGIIGTSYKPLDNEYQIKEALEEYCKLINSKENIFERALLAMLLISYIQPFADGNKRTGRILANAILLSNNLFPISLNNIDVNLYKEALLVFYEINNLYLFKELFIQQCDYSVNNYFVPALN